MKFENLINLSGQQFRRITGVKRNTFDKMVEIVTAADKIKKAKGGRPNRLWKIDIIEERNPDWNDLYEVIFGPEEK